MKVVIGLIVVGAVALLLLYQFGGYASLDPAQQAETFRKTVKPGMGWEDVLDAAEPQEVVRMKPIRAGVPGGQAAAVDFNRQQVADQIQNGKMPAGFMFRYRFTPAHHYEVMFDEQGQVVYVHEPPTTQDLLEGQLYTR